MATTYTAAQLFGGGALNTEEFQNSGENNLIKMSITLPMITPADRKHNGVGQCGLIIETVNLGFNPTIRNREFEPPFGRNPTVNYMDAGYTEVGDFITNIVAEEDGFGFFPQQPVFDGFEQLITFESLGIQHNLFDVPGSVCSAFPGPEAPSFERCYLPQRDEGRKIASFKFFNTNESEDEGTTKTFYWYPSNTVTGYREGEEPGEFFYGSVRFRGVGNFSLTTTAIPLLGEG